MHKALATNLWVFGPEYSLMASNRQLRTIIEDYTGPDATDRPDLFLAGNVLKQRLLIEFKKPTLTGKLGLPLEILVIGGEVVARSADFHDKLFATSNYPTTNRMAA